MVWFQGYDDVVSVQKTSEYGENLSQLIRNLRLDLEAPHLPVVVGELGMEGVDPDVRDRDLRFREIQLNVTLMHEFRRTTRFSPQTSSFVVKGGEKFAEKTHYYGRADSGELVGNKCYNFFPREDND